MGCLVLGKSSLKCLLWEIQGESLGIDIDIFNQKGKRAIKDKGELVIKKPFPTVPIKFWNDYKDKKFKKLIFQNIKIFGIMEILSKEL